MKETIQPHGLEGTPLGEYSSEREKDEKDKETPNGKNEFIQLNKKQLRALVESDDELAKVVLDERRKLAALSAPDLRELAKRDRHAELVLNARRLKEMQEDDPHKDLGYV